MKKGREKDNSTMNHQELKMRETRGTFLEFGGAEINKNEVSVPEIIFRVQDRTSANGRPQMSTWIMCVCVADTHQRHLLLFHAHYTHSMIKHTHLHSQLTGELGLLSSWLSVFLHQTYFNIQHSENPSSNLSASCWLHKTSLKSLQRPASEDGSKTTNKGSANMTTVFTSAANSYSRGVAVAAAWLIFSIHQQLLLLLTV